MGLKRRLDMNKKETNENKPNIRVYPTQELAALESQTRVQNIGTRKEEENG